MAQALRAACWGSRAQVLLLIPWVCPDLWRTRLLAGVAEAGEGDLQPGHLLSPPATEQAPLKSTGAEPRS